MAHSESCMHPLVIHEFVADIYVRNKTGDFIYSILSIKIIENKLELSCAKLSKSCG